MTAEAAPSRERGERGGRRPAPAPVQAVEGTEPQTFGELGAQGELSDVAPGAEMLEGAVSGDGTPAADGERDGRRRRRRRGGRGRDEASAEGGVEGENGEARAEGEAPVEGAEGVVAAEGELQADGEGGPRRRGRGRDRNRGPRREDGVGDTSGETATEGLPGNAALTEAAGVAEPALAPALADDVAPRRERGDRGEHSEVTAPAVAAESDETPARVAVPFESRAFTAPAPVAAPAAPVAPVVPKFDLPVADLNSLAGSAGLEWVHSNADSVRAAQEAIASAPKAVHVPRERPPVVVVDEGPLVLVETRKDLSQIKLPFDTPAAQASGLPE